MHGLISHRQCSQQKRMIDDDEDEDGGGGSALMVMMGEEVPHFLYIQTPDRPPQRLLCYILYIILYIYIY